MVDPKVVEKKMPALKPLGPSEPRFTLLRYYRDIAMDALVEAETLPVTRRRKLNSKPGGPEYVIVPPHPAQRDRALKCHLTAIVFAGVYLDALLHIEGCAKLEYTEYMKVDREEYEEKLKVLGIKDAKLLDACKHFREVRKEIVHEKAFQKTPLRSARIEARRALQLVRSVSSAFKRMKKF